MKKILALLAIFAASHACAGTTVVLTDLPCANQDFSGYLTYYTLTSSGKQKEYGCWTFSEPFVYTVPDKEPIGGLRQWEANRFKRVSNVFIAHY